MIVSFLFMACSVSGAVIAWYYAVKAARTRLDIEASIDSSILEDESMLLSIR